MFTILYVLVILLVFKVDICDAWRVLEWLRVVTAVLVHPRREPLKLHHVLG